jgi:catechol 2,3-dioxygenase-like lactoylglutathione lyase family enzyme
VRDAAGNKETDVRISHLDHLVLTVADVDATVAFYSGILGMEAVTFGDGRRALRFGKARSRGAGRPARS